MAFKLKKKEKVNVSKNVLDSIPYKQVYQNGIIMVAPGEFSKSYAFLDTNFKTEPEEKKDTLLDLYSGLLSKFPPSVTVMISIYNNREDLHIILKDILMQAKRDDLNEYREDYNQIIQGKMEKGNNDIKKERYMTVCIQAESLEKAIKTFDAYEKEIDEYISQINGEGISSLSIGERLALFYSIYNGSTFSNFERLTADFREDSVFSLEKMHKGGTTTKNLITPGGIKKTESYVQLGERYAKTFLVSDYASTLKTTFLSEITDIPCGVLLSFIVNTIPSKKALKLVNSQNKDIKTDVAKRQMNASQQGYSMDLISDTLKYEQESIKDLLDQLMYEDQKAFYTSLLVTVFGNSLEELNANAERFKMKLEPFMCQSKLLLGQQLLALHSCMPFGKKLIPMDHFMTTQAVQGLNPFYMQELMDKGGIYYGCNQETDNLIIINRKTLQKSPHGLITGTTGSGKSFIAKGEIEANLMNSDDDIMIIDPDNEYVPLAEAFHGQVIDFMAGSQIHINPFDINLSLDIKDKEDPIVVKCNFITSLINTMLGDQIFLSPFEINIIHKACRNILLPYVDALREQRCDITDAPTLVDLYNELLTMDEGIGRRIAANIEIFCIGSYDLFAHQTNIDPKARFQVYAIRDVPSNMRKLAMQICMENIWNKTLENKKKKKTTQIYVDEFYLLLNDADSSSYLKMLFKRIRKYNGIITGITQNIEDCLITPEGRAIVDNCGFAIMLNQSELGREHLQDIFHIPHGMLSYIKDKKEGTGLIYNGRSIVAFDYTVPDTSKLYKIMSTKARED